MIKFLFDGKGFNTREEAEDYIVDNVTFDDFDEYLDGNLDDVDILGLKYRASEVLKNVDKIAYEQMYYDYIDGCCSDIEEIA